MESIHHSMESTPHSMDSTWNNLGRVKYCDGGGREWWGESKMDSEGGGRGGK